MTPADKLLPCPFCGGDASESSWAGAGAHSVDCDACDFAMGDATEAKVRAKWNTRHNPDANALRVAVEAFDKVKSIGEDCNLSDDRKLFVIGMELGVALAKINRQAEGGV